MKEYEKIGVIQEPENRTAAEQGREPAKVVSSSKVTSYGSYNSTTNQMNINVNSFSSYETLDTYVHESNHAYQAPCVNNGIGYDEYTRYMMGVETDEIKMVIYIIMLEPLPSMICSTIRIRE